jgi:hypothetical protein
LALSNQGANPWFTTLDKKANHYTIDAASVSMNFHEIVP